MHLLAIASNKIGKICIWSHPCTNQLKIWTEQIVIMLQNPKISQMCIWYEVVTAGWNMNVVAQRSRSPCFSNRLLFVTLPGMGDNNLAPVLTRANWIMHHSARKFLQDETISEDIFTSIPITAAFMSATWSGSASYRISIVMSPNP